MRSAFDAHFENPHAHSRDHQVWNYWYVPDTYTYLKTTPVKVMPEPLVARFLNRLNSWAVATLGLSTRLHPWLSLYVDGCGQAIHNDALAGQMGFVYSITRWDTRNFLGGETLLFRQGHYWETERIKTAGAGNSFYEKVPSKFNQLLIFDDRIIHGVQPIQGTMDPLQGRVVLHGHLKADVVVITGPLTADAAAGTVTPILNQIQVVSRQNASSLHGFITVRLTIQADGQVTAIQELCDRLLTLSPDTSRLGPFKRDVAGILSQARFPAASGASELTLPVVVGA
jgi:hypothetical protein